MRLLAMPSRTPWRGSLCLREERLAAPRRALRLAQLAADDDPVLERLARDLDELRRAVVHDPRGRELRGADLQADERCFERFVEDDLLGARLRGAFGLRHGRGSTGTLRGLSRRPAERDLLLQAGWLLRLGRLLGRPSSFVCLRLLRASFGLRLKRGLASSASSAFSGSGRPRRLRARPALSACAGTRSPSSERSLLRLRLRLDGAGSSSAACGSGSTAVRRGLRLGDRAAVSTVSSTSAARGCTSFSSFHVHR